MVDTVLVTGARGFVGRHLLPVLVARGYRVRATTRRQDQPARGQVDFIAIDDFERPVDWARHLDGIGFIVHLAAVAHRSGVAPAVYERVNHLATADLAKAAAAAGVGRMVFVSSVGAQTGPSARGTISEEMQPTPAGPYGESKLAAERSLAGLPLETVILRPVLVYGPGAPGNMRALLRLAKLRCPLPFRAIGNRRSLVSIDNVTEAISWALTHPAAAGQTLLVADDTALSLPEMIGALRRGLGRGPGLFPVPAALIQTALTVAGRRPMWNRLAGDLVISNRKLVSLGWTPVVDTPAGLMRLAVDR